MNLTAFRAFQGRLRELIGEAGRLAEELGFSALVQVCQDLDRRLAAERFTVAVLGEIKRGKSSLINALLGAEVLPKAALVCTAALCIIRHGVAPRAVIQYRDGGQREVPTADLPQVATKKNPEAGNFSHIEVEYPLPLLAEGIVLVDTPGVNDTDEIRRRLTEEFIPRSDGVLFVLNAGQPFSDSEMRFLTTGILRHHIRKLWFVVNALDRLASDDEREEALAYCQEQIDQVLPQARLYGVSAKTYLEGRRAQDPQRMAASGIPDFLESLTRDLVASRWEGLIDVPLGLFGSFLAELERGIAWEASLLEKSATQRAEMARQLEAECRSLIEEKGRLTQRFLNEAESLVYEIARGSAHPSEEGLSAAICLILQDPEASEADMQQRLGHLYHDRLQAYLQALIKDLHRRLAPLARQLSAEFAHRVGRLDTRATMAGGSGGPAASKNPMDHGVFQPMPLPDLPQLDLEAGTLLTRLAPILSLGLLATGNLVLAALAMTPALFRRWGPADAPQVIAGFRERLDEGGRRIREELFAHKSEIARTLADQMLQGFAPLMHLVDDAMERARRLAGEADHWRVDRARDLERARAAAAALVERLNDLRREAIR